MIAVIAVAILLSILILLHSAKYISIRLRKYQPAFFTALIRFPRYVHGFGKCLSFPKRIMPNVMYKNGFLKVNYIVPESICIKENSGNRFILGLGGILAIADSMTTLLIMTDDLSHRPGVSVTLSGVMVENTNGTNPVLANDEIVIVCKNIKLGATLGFVEAYFYKNNSIFAYVRHVKYLKLGFLYDNWIGPLLPLKIMSRGWFYGSQRLTDMKILEELSQDQSASLGECLNIKAVNSASSDSFSFNAHKGLQNPFDSLHGGAIACIAEECASKYKQMGRRDACVTSMEINYLTAGKGNIHVTVEPILHVCDGTGNISSASDHWNDAQKPILGDCIAITLEDLIKGVPHAAPAQKVPAAVGTRVDSRTFEQEYLRVLLRSAPSSKKDVVYADCKVRLRYSNS